MARTGGRAYKKIEAESKTQHCDDHIERDLAIMRNGTLILIDLQGQDEADKKRDSKHKPHGLLPQQLPCLLARFKASRVGGLAGRF